ncbi:DrmB family protein [Streptomyces rubiginosohelvolus]|uniref:DrmB family protein n=1 Tax=Streptomyces rubiginosohelvolus TaxID=67362 RepID=UPI0036FE33B4
MSEGRIRRAQLVSPFGVGAMSILVNGTSVVTAGLDHWFHSDEPGNLYIDEYVVDEWRLQERLNTRQLRLPPDARTPVVGGGVQRNVKLTVPVLRFPGWSFCMYCKRLGQSPLSMAQPVRCRDPKHDAMKHRPIMAQVPFIAICERGHMDDFPWSSWVHRSITPSCGGVLRLLSRGGGTLAGQVVRCDGCGSDRTMERVLEATTDDDGCDHTWLSRTLSKEGEFNCTGSRPWVADPGSGCGQPLRGALRSAGNVYFPKVESAIFLPRLEGGASAEVLDMLRQPEVSVRVQLINDLVGSVPVSMLRKQLPPELLSPFSDEELTTGLMELLGPADPDVKEPTGGGELTSISDWRRPEYTLLREKPTHPDLTATDPGTPDSLRPYLDRVRRVETLRETRALRGFTRVRDGNLRVTDGKALLRQKPVAPEHDWLPAYVVKGEGIYLELNPTALAKWETRKEVLARASRISTSFSAVQQQRGLSARDVTPRLVLVHTLAHLLINELVYTCGYSSASLRERLYVSADPGSEMAGVLIYTAAGDSEGTMGGLVRMAFPDSFEPVFAASLDHARWCSTDPVCMELGQAGQGPDSCNLAACHGCALLPETSCEEFNRFLDRGLIIGTFHDPSLGFFSANDQPGC